MNLNLSTTLTAIKLRIVALVGWARGPTKGVEPYQSSMLGRGPNLHLIAKLANLMAVSPTLFRVNLHLFIKVPLAGKGVVSC